MKLSYNYLFNYLPKRYAANAEEELNRRIVYDFKDGCCSMKIKESFSNVINKVTGNKANEWVVLFIPASSKSRTITRFSELAQSIKSRTGITASLNGIRNLVETESMCRSGHRFDKTSTYQFDRTIINGKNVILIDDVITSGLSFRTCAEKLFQSGAKSVRGLFVAKTVNPDWPSNN